VALAILAANLGFVALALWSRDEPWIALAAAAAIVAMLLGWLARRTAG
jgi:hypothetical protein